MEEPGDRFFLTEETPDLWSKRDGVGLDSGDGSVSKELGSKELGSIEAGESMISVEDKEFLKMLLGTEGKESGVDETDNVDMDSEFMLNHPNADKEKFGNIKVNTFNEWARLSLLDYDKQISYNGVKLPNMKNLVRELKCILNKTDVEYTERKRTKSHLKESLKAMKFLLQKNALELLEIKDKSKELSSVKKLKPTALMVSFIHNFIERTTRQIYAFACLKIRTTASRNRRAKQ